MSLLSAVLQEAEKANTVDYTKQLNILFPRIKDLTERIQMLSWSLQENLIENYVNFNPTKSLEQLNYKNRKHNIITDIENLFIDIKSLKEKFEVSDVSFKTSHDKLIKSYDNFKDLCFAAEGKRILSLANHEFARYQYADAILSVKSLIKQLKTLKFEGNTDKAVLKLRAQAESQISIFAANVSVEWEDIFSWYEKKGVHHLTYSLSVQKSDPTLIQNILKTLYTTERLNAELGLFSHFFMDKLLHNIIRHNCDIFTEDVIAPNHTIVFNIKFDLNDGSKPNFQTVFNNLMAVFDFLQSTLGAHFNCETSFIGVFAETIRTKFFNKIITDCIRNNLPSCDSSFQSYQNLVIELDTFNKFLVDLKFVAAEDSPLNEFIRDTECVLFNKKCDKLLADIRLIIGQSLSYGTITVGMDTCQDNESMLNVTDKDAHWALTRPLFLPKCVISQNVKEIMSTIVEHLEESAKLPEKYSNQLVLYIRSISVLYQSVVPQKFKVNLECCPLDIALFFNNCFYLAHGFLGPPWRTILPESLADRLTTSLIECIQDLRILGLEKISLYLQKKKDAIIKNVLLDELTPWTHTSYQEFDSAINSALTLMKDLKSCWLNILPAKMYQLSLCTLIQVLCQSILQRIFADSKPIDEDLVYLIAMRLEDMVHEFGTLFEEPIEFDKRIDVWRQFTTLPVLLKAQLHELSTLWSGGELRAACSCEQLRQLVKMRFPDDARRLHVLKEIQ